jgi:uncharacterized C2H2 Zn-finger protein
MDRPKEDKPAGRLMHSETTLIRFLRNEIDSGIAMAADPTNANLPDLAIRITSVNSPWYSQTCLICKHKFREGDQVRLCPQCGKAYHDDDQYDLHCWQKKFTDGEICTRGGVDRFGRGVARCDFLWFGSLPEKPLIDNPDSQIAKTHVTPSVLLVTQFLHGLEQIWRPFGEQPVVKVEPGSPIVGNSCPWCRFRIRSGDWVVACPCRCGTYFHQDVFRHLTCWNEWNGVEGNNYCPVTGRSYEESKADG